MGQEAQGARFNDDMLENIFESTQNESIVTKTKIPINQNKRASIFLEVESKHVDRPNFRKRNIPQNILDQINDFEKVTSSVLEKKKELEGFEKVTFKIEEELMLKEQELQKVEMDELREQKQEEKVIEEKKRILEENQQKKENEKIAKEKKREEHKKKMEELSKSNKVEELQKVLTEKDELVIEMQHELNDYKTIKQQQDKKIEELEKRISLLKENEIFLKKKNTDLLVENTDLLKIIQELKKKGIELKITKIVPVENPIPLEEQEMEDIEPKTENEEDQEKGEDEEHKNKEEEEKIEERTEEKDEDKDEVKKEEEKKQKEEENKKELKEEKITQKDLNENKEEKKEKEKPKKIKKVKRRELSATKMLFGFALNQQRKYLRIAEIIQLYYINPINSSFESGKGIVEKEEFSIIFSKVLKMLTTKINFYGSLESKIVKVKAILKSGDQEKINKAEDEVILAIISHLELLSDDYLSYVKNLEDVHKLITKKVGTDEKFQEFLMNAENNLKKMKEKTTTLFGILLKPVEVLDSYRSVLKKIGKIKHKKNRKDPIVKTIKKYLAKIKKILSLITKKSKQFDEVLGIDRLRNMVYNTLRTNTWKAKLIGQFQVYKLFEGEKEVSILFYVFEKHGSISLVFLENLKNGGTKSLEILVNEQTKIEAKKSKASLKITDKTGNIHIKFRNSRPEKQKFRKVCKILNVEL